MPDQQHPQYARDRDLLNQLMQGARQRPIPDRILAEVARLRIRYMGFPGAHDLQQDLDWILEEWTLTEEALFTKTRAIHSRKDVYEDSFSQRDDWA